MKRLNGLGWAATAGGLLLSIGALAADGPNGLDPASTEALQKTTAMLRDPALREKAIRGTPGAQSAASEAQALSAQGVDGNALYGISADIFEDLAKQAQGDPIKMQELLELAKKDPRAFAEKLSQKNQRAIRELSSESGAKQPAAKP